MDRCRLVLTQLESEGKITEEEAISLRADRVTQRELWIEYFPSPENIDENYIDKLIEKHRQRLIGQVKEDTASRFKEEAEKAERLRIQEAQKKAKDYANDRRAKYIVFVKAIVTLVFFIIACGCVIGLIKSVESAEKTVYLIAFIIVSILSIIDTLRSKSKLIGRWIDKRANYYETTIYEKKLKEYMALLNR